MQTFEEMKIDLEEEAASLANKAEMKAIEKHEIAIDNNNSNILLMLGEKIEAENKALLQKINEQNETISKLEKQLDDLEKQIQELGKSVEEQQ